MAWFILSSRMSRWSSSVYMYFSANSVVSHSGASAGHVSRNWDHQTPTTLTVETARIAWYWLDG